MVQGLLDINPSDEASCQRVLALVQEEAVVKQVNILFLSLVKRLISHRQAVAQDIAPVHAVDDIFNIGGIIAHGIHTADDATH